MKKTKAIIFCISIFASQFCLGQQTDLISALSNKGKPVYLKPLINFSIRGNFEVPVTQSKLRSASALKDFIKDYPSNWIEDYVSVELTAVENGNSTAVKGVNANLNAEQKKLLSAMRLNAKLEVNIKYHRKNSVTGLTDLHTSHLVMTVIPETEAKFPGGETYLNNYINKNIVDRIDGDLMEVIRNCKVLFMVDEKGNVADAKMTSSTGDNKTDQLIMEALYEMPVWSPALDENKTKVRQQFEFSIGQGGC